MGDTKCSLPCSGLLGKWACVEVQLHSFLTLHGSHCQLPDTSPTTSKGKSTSWYPLNMMLANPMLVLMLWRRERSLTPAENQFLSCSVCSLVTILTILPWLGEQYPDNEIHKSDTRIPLYWMKEDVQSALSTFASNSRCTLWLDFWCFLFWNSLCLQTRKVTMAYFWDDIEKYVMSNKASLSLTQHLYFARSAGIYVDLNFQALNGK